MQFLLEILKSFIALIAAAALSPFGVELHAPKVFDREVERVQVCSPEASSTVTVTPPSPC